jgi:hypothetical protein
MKLIAIDPGVMTGYTYARITTSKQLEVYPFQMTDAVDDFWHRLRDFAPNTIIMEDFEFRGRARTGLNLFPVQLIGIAHLYELTEPTGKCQLIMQQAGIGKAYYTDPVLKGKGVYKRGIPHGMDSLRHLLQWATFRGGAKYVDFKTGEKIATLLDTWKDTT